MTPDTMQVREMMRKRGFIGQKIDDEHLMLFLTSQRLGYEYLWQRIPIDHIYDRGALYSQISNQMEEEFGVTSDGYRGESDEDKLREASMLSGYFSASEDYFEFFRNEEQREKCSFINQRYWYDAAFFLSRLRGISFAPPTRMTQ